MEEAAANWRYEKLHEDQPFHDGSFKNWAKERSKMFPYHFSDGVRILVAETDLYPDDNFLSGATATPPGEAASGPSERSD